MRIRDIAALSYRNISRGRLRTALTVLAVSIGIASVLLLTAIGQSGKKLINTRLEKIGLSGVMIIAGDYEGLTVAAGEMITKRIPGALAAMPFEPEIGEYSLENTSSYSAVIIGVDEKLPDFMALDIKYGRSFSKAESDGGEKVCIVDSKFALDNFKRENVAGKRIFLYRGMGSEEFLIVGVANTELSELTNGLGLQIPTFIYAPFTALGGGEYDSLGQMAVKISPDRDATAAAAGIASYLRRTAADGKYFQVENISGYRKQFDSVLETLTLVLTCTAAISLAVAGIGVMNSMLATVNDRRAEIGICKAIGASKGQIGALFLCEALLLVSGGGVIGLAAGAILALISGAIVGIMPVMGAKSVLLPVFITLFTGLLSGFLPAVKAAAMQPVAAIRKD